MGRLSIRSPRGWHRACVAGGLPCCGETRDSGDRAGYGPAVRGLQRRGRAGRGPALATERDSARLLRVTPQGRVSTAGTVPGVEPSGEGGLLGVAVSPSFGRDRLVYVYFSTGADNRIARFRYAGGSIGPLDTVLTGIPRAGIHNGGRLAFGPDDDKILVIRPAHG